MTALSAHRHGLPSKAAFFYLKTLCYKHSFSCHFKAAYFRLSRLTAIEGIASPQRTRLATTLKFNFLIFATQLF